MRYQRSDGATIEIEGEPPFADDAVVTITLPSGESQTVSVRNYSVMTHGAADLTPIE